MMRFIDYHEIEMWGRIEIQQSVMLSSAMIFTFIHAAVQDGIRNNGLVIAYRPFLISMGVRNCLPKDRSVERNEVLIKALHFQFPFSLSHQRLRAYDQYVVQLASCFQFLYDQPGFNGFTNTDTVCDQDLRFIGFDQL